MTLPGSDICSVKEERSEDGGPGCRPGQRPGCQRLLLRPLCAESLAAYSGANGCCAVNDTPSSPRSTRSNRAEIANPAHTRRMIGLPEEDATDLAVHELYQPVAENSPFLSDGDGPLPGLQIKRVGGRHSPADSRRVLQTGSPVYRRRSLRSRIALPAQHTPPLRTISEQSL